MPFEVEKNGDGSSCDGRKEALTGECRTTSLPLMAAPPVVGRSRAGAVCAPGGGATPGAVGVDVALLLEALGAAAWAWPGDGCPGDDCEFWIGGIGGSLTLLTLA